MITSVHMSAAKHNIHQRSMIFHRPMTKESNNIIGGHVTQSNSWISAGAQGIKSPVCSVGICTAMSLKKNRLLQSILKHIEAHHVHQSSILQCGPCRVQSPYAKCKFPLCEM